MGNAGAPSDAASVAHLPTTTLDNRQLEAPAYQPQQQQSHQVQYTPGSTVFADPQVLMDPQTGNQQELELVTVTPNGLQVTPIAAYGQVPPGVPVLNRSPS